MVVLKQKLLHRLTALSRKGFGIHSPFIFNFQCKVLNPKKEDKTLYLQINKEPDKVLRSILRMQIYFDLHNSLVLVKKYQKGFEKYKVSYTAVPYTPQNYNLVVLDATRSFSEKWLQKEAFVVLSGTYKEILQHPLRKKCIVFLNLYYIGICIFKQGLSHQEFRLRL